MERFNITGDICCQGVITNHIIILSYCTITIHALTKPFSSVIYLLAGVIELDLKWIVPSGIGMHPVIRCIRSEKF
jgi:hypothetical protein